MADDFIAITRQDFSRTNFTSMLLRLIFKADWENLARLAQGFPKEVALFQWWRGSPREPTDEEIRYYCMKWCNVGYRSDQGELDLIEEKSPVSTELPF